MSQLMRRVAKKGFTLIELMIVVAIIGILAAIAIPKFADLITKSKESAAKGSLGSLRGAVTIYYSDSEGLWPASLTSGLTAGNKYLDTMPSITIPRKTSGAVHDGHASNRDVTEVAGPAAVADTPAAIWNYQWGSGQIVIGCTHQDSKDSIWSSW